MIQGGSVPDRPSASVISSRAVSTPVTGTFAYRVRPATPADAEAICRIYNQGIEDRVATLETELRTPDERRQWLTNRSPRYPVIVAVAEPASTSVRPPSEQASLTVPATVAWGSLNVFNAREAYRFVADFSVYVERAWRGKGVGRALLARLIELGREHGFHKLALSAFPTNAGGVALYERMGFRTVGIYREQGQLDGRWVDTIIMEKLL
ncbi:MAG: N-acetyltransferase [Candidatus Rokubacteria bacterium]|nr:N-acetyltransferase [Candidatus Rokubacteria bacterium]